MAFVVDHLFIWTDIGAELAGDRLLSLGLKEGSSNRHPGQGTCNRRFFFDNMMLELLWVDDPSEAQSEVIRPTHLWERWRDRPTRCPFGICIRAESAEDQSLPFTSWDYHPPYLPKGMQIDVATNSDRLTEPFLFHTPFGGRPDQLAPEDHELNKTELFF
jgi:hypothetical protein